MRYWTVVVPAERYRAERLFHHETLELGGPQPQAPRADGPAPGDCALLVASTEPPVVFGLARVRSPAPLVLAYTQRSLDAPRPVDGLALDGAITAIGEEAYRAAATRLGPPMDRRHWLVSVDLPIEAESPGEAVREFWSYVMGLGPRELPAFVAPLGDELAMQAYVLGERTNLDPEEDED